jgi:hypothetical protein
VGSKAREYLVLIFVCRGCTIGSADKRYDKLFKLIEGQFESAKIKVQNAKLLNPPLADGLFYYCFYGEYKDRQPAV